MSDNKITINIPKPNRDSAFDAGSQTNSDTSTSTDVKSSNQVINQVNIPLDVDAVGKTTVKHKEIGGPKGPEPTRYGDWERKGRCIDF